MTDGPEPIRLIRGDDARIRSLLTSARRDGPSSRALRAAPIAISALLAAGAAEAATAAAATGAAGAALPKTLSAVAAVAGKWLAIGVVAGSLVSAAAVRIPTQPPPSAPKKLESHRPRSPQSPPARAARAAITPPAPSASASASIAPSPRIATSTAPTRARERADVAREIAVLDAATAALARGAPEQALRLLDSTGSLAVHSLGPEATVLRVRALLKLGRREAAQRLVDDFVRTAPHAPQVVVLRELLAASIP